jgi:hypothetical protein
MNRIRAVLLLGACLAAPAWACEGLVVEQARVIEAPPGATILAAYATLRNSGDKVITITSADSPDFASAEFHQMMMVDGMMHMQQEDTLIIPAHSLLTLKSGQSHLMLFDPKRPLKSGDNVTLNLHCGAASQAIAFPVQAPQPPAQNQ